MLGSNRTSYLLYLLDLSNSQIHRLIANPLPSKYFLQKSGEKLTPLSTHEDTFLRVSVFNVHKVLLQRW